LQQTVVFYLLGSQACYAFSMKEIGTLLALAGLVGIAASIALGLKDGPSALPYFLTATALCVALGVGDLMLRFWRSTFR
jgi:hypothetical protein